VLEVLGDRARAHVDRAGDGQVGPAGCGEFQHLHLAGGEAGHVIAGIRHDGAGLLPAAHPPQRVAQRLGQDAEQRPVGFGEVPLRPVEGDRGQPLLARPRQDEDHLVLYRDMPEEF